MAPAKKPPAKRPKSSKSAPVPRNSVAANHRPSPAAQRFRARLEPDHTSLKWVIARIPSNIEDRWTTMRRLRVRGEINGHAFRTSLFPLPGNGNGHFLLVNKTMQRGAGVEVGMEADLWLEPDLEERPSSLPAELKSAFQGDRDLLHYAEALSESNRREISKWIDGVKGEDARSRRAAQMAERLLLAMDGERATPPVLEALFRKEPLARAGWKAMTPAQRRSHLLGIFYYQTPEARVRRAEKAVADARRHAGKLARGSVGRNGRGSG